MKYDRDAALRRNMAFITDETRNGILVRCGSYDISGLKPLPALEDADLSHGCREYMDTVIHNFMRACDAHEGIDDDWLPSMKPFLGIAEHSCFLGGDVVFGGNTSYHKPCLSDITRWREIGFHKTHPHYALLMDCMEYNFRKSKEYGYYASLRGFDGPLDIANAARGNDILYDFFDEPEEVSAFLDLCADGVLWTYRNQFPLTTEVSGGVISGFGTWMPAGSIGHISEDATVFFSPDTYRQFGMQATSRMLDNFDYALLHVHAMGRRHLPAFRELKKIKMIEISNDPNEPRAIDIYKEYAQALDGIAVSLRMSASEVRENIGFLRGRRTLIDLEAGSPDEAQRIVDLTRA